MIAVSITLHTALSHLDKRNTYVRMLFIDYSSAFSTIVPSKLITKLRNPGARGSLGSIRLGWFVTWRLRAWAGGQQELGERSVDIPFSGALDPGCSCGSLWTGVCKMTKCNVNVERLHFFKKKKSAILILYFQVHHQLYGSATLHHHH
jgi:hypothetical protein